MRIGLDFDGVISDCGELKSVGAKHLFSVDIPPAKFKKEILLGEGLLTKEQYRAVQKMVYGTDFGLQMHPVPGMAEGVAALLKDGHSLVVITLRGDAELEIARRWLATQGLALELVGLGYGKTKERAAAEHGVEVYIDDDLEKLQPLIGFVPYRFLMSWPYNEQDRTEGIAMRVSSWFEFLLEIDQIGARSRYLPPGMPVLPKSPVWNPDPGPKFK